MDGLLADTPALTRLRWLLAGLDDRWARGTDVATALSPDFARDVPPQTFEAVTRERAGRLAPLRVVGLDADGDAATARFRTRDEQLWVAHVGVEAAPPHRITMTYAQPWVPEYLAPALPPDFTGVRIAGGHDAALLVFGGVPGTGKTTVAEAVGAALGIPTFALDWLLGALTPFGMHHRSDLMSVGEELLTTLAYRELHAGRSAVLDATSEDPRTRTRWETLALAAGARLVRVVCVCTDQALHRGRVEHRVRGIPGWADPGDWPDVVARTAAFPPWRGALVLDTARPLEQCVAAVLEQVGPRRPGHRPAPDQHT